MITGVGLFVARAWTQLASMVLLVVAARLLTHDEVGVFTLGTALTMILTQLVGVGTYEYVIRERLDPDAEHTAFWLNGAVAVALMLVGLAIALPAGLWFRSDVLPGVVLALSPLTIPAGCRSAVEAVMVRDGKLNKLALTTATVEAVSMAAGVTALVQGLGLWSLVVHKWVQTFGAAIGLALVARWTPRQSFSRETMRRIAHFGGGIFGDRVLGFFQTYGADFFLGALISPAAVASYRLGARLVTTCVTIITEPLRQLNWKRLSDAAHEGRSVAGATEAAIGMTFGLMMAPMIGLVVTADLVVTVILGERWASSAVIVQLLALSSLIATPQQLTESALGVTSRTRWLPAVRLAGVVTLFLMLFVFGRGGPEGAAIGQLLAAVVFSLAAIILQGFLIGVRPSGYLRQLTIFAAAAGLMAGAVLLCRWGLAPLRLPDIVVLAASVVAGAACYMTVAAVAWRRDLVAAWTTFRTASRGGVGAP